MTFYGSQIVVERYNMMGPVKAALEAVTRYLAAELGPKGIRVHAISPGPLRTRAASGITDFDELIAKAQEKAPSRRLVSIEDVGVAVAFLSMDGAKLITGETLYPTAAITSSIKYNDGSATIRGSRDIEGRHPDHHPGHIIFADDADALLKAFNNLDRESVYGVSSVQELTDAELAQLTDVDFSRVVALLVKETVEEGAVGAHLQQTIPVQGEPRSRS